MPFSQSTPKGRELSLSYKPSPYQVRKRLPTQASQEREGLWLTQISPPPPGCFPGLTVPGVAFPGIQCGLPHRDRACR